VSRLPAIGSAAFSAIIEAVGRDLRAWSDAQGVAVVRAAIARLRAARRLAVVAARRAGSAGRAVRRVLRAAGG
jgi:hypothetical protein